MKISEKIKLFRASQNMTQKDMERLLNIGTGSIQNYELERTKPNHGFLNTFCNQFPEHALWLISDHADVTSIKNKALSNK
jgi:transcriptional regulator with XRE-family HTH domain